MTIESGELAATPEAAPPPGPTAARRSATPRTTMALIYRGTRRFLGVSIALLVMMTFLALTQDSFLTSTNLTNVLRSMAVLYMVAIGNTFVLLTAGFDLSVGSMLSLAGVAVAGFLSGGINPWLAVGLTLLLCTLLGGVLNGMLVGKAGLSFFVVTLASLSLLRGAVFVYSDGETKRVDEQAILSVGDGKLGGFSVPILLMIATFVVSILVLHYTRFGRAVYAVGGNKEAARLSGINVAAVIIAVYAISGFFAGLAGVIQTGRLAAAAPVAGTGIELSAAAAVLLGGTSFSGGSGGVGGTVVGVLFVGVLRNGLGLMGVSSFWQDVVTGIILIAAISIDRISQLRES
ncbi:MAG: ABC transporter permease [Ilumatobacteraceae bacterium]